MKYTHIIEGRDLVRSFRKDCARCTLLAMGPVSKVNSAFYISQVDLFGPFRSYSVHNKSYCENMVSYLLLSHHRGSQHKSDG